MEPADGSRKILSAIKIFSSFCFTVTPKSFFKRVKAVLKKLGVNFANNGLNTFLNYSGEIAAFHANGTHFTR